MITRLAVNNFRSLVKFETQFGPFAVLCGPNGSGKSTVFEAIRSIRDLGTGARNLAEVLPPGVVTSWEKAKEVKFDLSLRSQEGEFRYLLKILKTVREARIVEEAAWSHGSTIFRRSEDEVVFSGRPPETIKIDQRRSLLGVVQDVGDIKGIDALRKALGQIVVLRIDPLAMERESREESQQPSLNLQNLTSWYRSFDNNPSWKNLLLRYLRELWPDFENLSLVNAGSQSRVLFLRFSRSATQRGGSIVFDQLSHGEKVLLGLYMVSSGLAAGAIDSVLIDEPDTYVGLPELQPWTLDLMGGTGGVKQAILISHHPEILNVAGEQFGHYMWRENHTSPAQIGPLKAVKGLSLGETVLRGWVRA